MTAVLLAVVGLAVLVAVLWLIGAREPVLREKGPVWFIALRGGDGALAPHACKLWSSTADQVFIGGGDDPYWTRFILAAGDGATPLVTESFDDAFIARVRLFSPPRIALGLIRVLVASGILSRPSTENVATDVQSIGFNPDHMPSAGAITRLLARPGTYAPAMVNFLRYTRDGAGRADYRKYGIVAMRTVFRTRSCARPRLGRLAASGMTSLRCATRARPPFSRWSTCRLIARHSYTATRASSAQSLSPRHRTRPPLLPYP